MKSELQSLKSKYTIMDLGIIRHLTDAHPFRKHLRGPPKQAQEREQKSTPASKPVRPQEAKAQGFRSEPRRASPEAS